jgi:hypothetical protein
MSGFKASSIIVSNKDTFVTPTLSGDLSIVARNGSLQVFNGLVEEQVVYLSELNAVPYAGTLGTVGSTITVTPSSADYELLFSTALTDKKFLVHYAMTCSGFSGSATLILKAVDETKTLITDAVMDGMRTINGSIDTFGSRTNYGYPVNVPGAGHSFGTFAMTIPAGHTGEVHLQLKALDASGVEITVYLRHITIIGVPS